MGIDFEEWAKELLSDLEKYKNKQSYLVEYLKKFADLIEERTQQEIKERIEGVFYWDASKR